MRPGADFFLGILSGERRGVGYDALRMALALLAGIYCAGLELYLAAERVGLRRRTVLRVPVISVGNLTVGGTGKTPMTHWIASQLQTEGFRPVVLSRGHGGSLSKGTAQVSDDAGHVLLNAAEAGDEAALLAKLLPGVPVFIGKDRRASARAAFEKFQPDLFLLDDGLQYWQLARDLDVVLLDSRQPFGNGWTLPRGTLREPKQHLRRSGMVVVTRADLASQDELAAVKKAVQTLAPKASVYPASHRFAELRPLNESAARQGTPKLALPVCGIAQPDSFFNMLSSAALPATTERLALDDHAVYDKRTVSLIKGKLDKCGADSIVTTEKDGVKLPLGEMDMPLYAAVMRLEIERADEFRAELMRRGRLPAAADRQRSL